MLVIAEGILNYTFNRFDKWDRLDKFDISNRFKNLIHAFEIYKKFN